MSEQIGALHRVKTRLARLGEKLRKEGEDVPPDDCISSPGSKHLLRQILHRGSSLHTTSGGVESGDSDSELVSESSGWFTRGRSTVQSRTLSDTDGMVSCESDEEPPPAALAAPHLTALLLSSRARNAAAVFQERGGGSSTVAECSLEASLVPVLGLAGFHPPSPQVTRPADDGTNSAPEISGDQTGLLEKLGQRIKQRSDRVHRVMFNICTTNLMSFL